MVRLEAINVNGERLTTYRLCVIPQIKVRYMQLSGLKIHL